MPGEDALHPRAVLCVDLAPDAVLTCCVKRGFRFLWVLAANGFVVWSMFTRLFGETFNGNLQSLTLWLEFSLEAILPALGIVLELLGRKSARWVNVGYLALAGCFWLAETVRWWSDSFRGVLLIIAIGLLALAGITEVVYRTTRNE